MRNQMQKNLTYSYKLENLYENDLFNVKDWMSPNKLLLKIRFINIFIKNMVQETNYCIFGSFYLKPMLQGEKIFFGFAKNMIRGQR